MDPLSPIAAMVSIYLTHFSTLSVILRESSLYLCTKGYIVGYTVGFISNYAVPPKNQITEHFSGDLLATGLGNGSTLCARKTLKNISYFLSRTFPFHGNGLPAVHPARHAMQATQRLIQAGFVNNAET